MTVAGLPGTAVTGAEGAATVKAAFTVPDVAMDVEVLKFESPA